MLRSVLALLAASFAYTIVRYHLLGPEPAEHIPAYLLNKAVSLASVSFLFRAAIEYRRNRDDNVRDWGTAALHAGYAHILLSVALLSEAYHPIFYDGSRLSMRGELAIGLGTLAAYGFWLIRKNRSNASIKRILQTVTALAAGGHLVSLGSGGWMAMGDWHGSLPPISLLGFILTFLSAVLFLLPHLHPKSS
jgi:hypothetical protein